MTRIVSLVGGARIPRQGFQKQQGINKEIIRIFVVLDPIKKKKICFISDEC